MDIRELNPQPVWQNFYSLTRIPRPSGHNEKVRAFLLDWAKERGIEAFESDGNVIFRVPATPGFENRKGVILQGHMDMVPQKTADTVHDFVKDPISTRIEDGWVGACGTTLGADNGIGVAIAMSVAADKSLKHGPVEVLATWDEETGMFGAKALKPGVLKGDILLNLDSEEEDELCIGCAGGLDGKADFRFRTYKMPEDCSAWKISVKGLQGGHSGMDISLYRANANILVARVLLPLLEQFGARLCDWSGGTLRNAIPFEGEAVVALPVSREAAAKKAVKAILADIAAEFAHSDPSGEYDFRKLSSVPGRYIQPSVALRAVRAVLACPNGVVRMSDTMPGLTETSTNLAIVRCEKGHLTVHSLMRSAVDSSKAFLAEQMRAVFTLAGASFETSGGYNGWTPKPETPSNDLLARLFEQIHGKAMKVMATHGGLECALLGAKYPEWEMVSIGPDIVHPHSPDERVRIDSVATVWKLVTAFLEQVPVKK